MPQQSNSRKTTKSKKKRLSKMPFFYIVILLIAVVITVCLVVRNNQKKEEEQAGQNTTEAKEEDKIILPEQTLIDFNNTENAKVENSVKENTSSKLAEPKTFLGLTFKDIKLKAEGGITRLTATVENNSSTRYEGGDIFAIFTNKDGSEYARLKGSLPEIEPGDTNGLDAGTTSDVTNAYDFRIEAR